MFKKEQVDSTEGRGVSVEISQIVSAFVARRRNRISDAEAAVLWGDCLRYVTCHNRNRTQKSAEKKVKQHA